MLIDYFSPAHIILISISLGFAAGIYFLVRRCNIRVQRITVISIMTLNVVQHLFKSYIYPQYEGLGFNALNSAYNMCALLILASPIAYFSRSERLRDFVFYTGSAAGVIAILIPYWNIGDEMLSADVIRFFICHFLLFTSSTLTLLLGHHKPSWKSSYRIATGFFVSLGVIILNDFVFLYMGLYPGVEVENLFESLRAINPVWSFEPPEAFPFVADIAKFFSPDIFVGDNKEGLFVPVLWYFVPIFLAISILTLPITALADKENFIRDMRSARARVKNIVNKCKELFASIRKKND